MRASERGLGAPRGSNSPRANPLASAHPCQGTLCSALGSGDLRDLALLAATRGQRRVHCAPIALLAAAVAGWCAWLPSSALGQDMTFDESESSAEEDSDASGTEGGSEGAEGGTDAFMQQLAAGSGETANMERGPRITETTEEIYAVQQIYALRINRLEIAPNVGFTLNDPYVSHPSAGIALNYWWTNVLAIGANFNWYQGLESESDLNFFVRRSTRVAVPITEWQFGANVNFTYVPFYGKFMAFNSNIFQWDAYIVGGAGVMRTRPLPVIDPEVRQFDFDFRLAFNLGIGIRVFVTRWLAIFAELRDYGFLERLENNTVAVPRVNPDGSCAAGARCDPATWTDGSVSFENNTTAHLGFTIFLPFDFDYELPK